MMRRIQGLSKDGRSNPEVSQIVWYRVVSFTNERLPISSRFYRRTINSDLRISHILLFWSVEEPDTFIEDTLGLV